MIEQDLLVVGGTCDATPADFDAVARRQNHIHQPDVAQLGQDAPRFTAEAGLSAGEVLGA